MSAIRPDLPTTTLPPAGANVAVRNAQAAFFRAALTGTAPVAAPPIQPQASMAAPQDTTPQEPRPARPGSLLDIRV